MRQPTRIPDRRPPAVPPDRTVPHAIARSAAPGPAAADAVRVPADPADPGGSAGTSRLSWGRTVAPGAGRPAISPAPDAATPDRAAVALRLSWRSKSRSVGAKPLSAGASPPSRRVPRGGGQTARIVPNWGRFRAAGGSTSFASARVGRLPGRSRSGWVSECARVGRLLGRSGSGRVRKCPSWAVTGAIRLGPGPQVPELGGYWGDPARAGFPSARVGRLLGRSGSGRVRKCPSWAVMSHGSPRGLTLRTAAARRPVGMPVVR